MIVSTLLRRAARRSAVAFCLFLVAGTAGAGEFLYTNNDVTVNSVSVFEVSTNAAGLPIGLVKLADVSTNGTGSGGGFFASNRIIICVVGNFLYVANTGSNTITVFSINAASGLLSQVGAPVATGATGANSAGISMGVTPDGKFLLAANSASRNVSVFSIDSANGGLSAIHGSPFAVPANADLDGVRVLPNGQFVAVAVPGGANPGPGGVVHVMSIAASGALASIAGSPFSDSGLANGSGVAGLDATCDSNFLYGGEATFSPTIVDVFKVDSTGMATGTAGSLSLVSTFQSSAADSNSNNLLVSRDQRHLFVTNNFSSQITVLAIDANSGGLTPIMGSPFSMNGTPSNPGGLATNLAGTLLYVGNFGDGSISVFSIAANGALSELAASPFSTGAGTGLLSIASFPSAICGRVPVANDDPGDGEPAIEAMSGQAININVLVNDDPGDGVANVTTTVPASGGTAVVEADFTVTYASGAGFGGTDTFTYVIEDINGDRSAPATVTVQVDGSVAVTESGAMNSPVFGGRAFPDSTAALSASISLAVTGGTSETACCTVRDWRVFRRWGRTLQLPFPFDAGRAMLDEPSCADVPSPGRGKLIIRGQYGVHTDPAIDDPLPEDHRFGICVVLTGLDTLGPIFIDAEARNAVGYDVNCQATSVDEQPITLGLSTDPVELFAPIMRSVSSDCDPRGIARWSTWYFSPNVERVTRFLSSSRFFAEQSFRFLGVLAGMKLENAADRDFLREITTLVLRADQRAIGKPRRQRDPYEAVRLLDDATRLALLIETALPGSPSPPLDNPYATSDRFPNPQATVVSYAAALRYIACSELANPGNTLACEMEDDIVDALPTLPSAPGVP